ncbi:MAG: TIGR01777 family oxidoreductase [Acidobacteriota bacterium]
MSSSTQPSRQIAVSGARGLLGSALCESLRADGHRVVPLVRPGSTADGIAWDPLAGTLDPESLVGFDAVVHLAGESIAERWTEAKKAAILDSRVHGTRTVAEAVAAAGVPVLVGASAVGFYGDRGDEVLTEASTKGDGFLAEVCWRWEAATAAAREAGCRVVSTRFGVVLSKRGGALAKMWTPFRLGAGGPLGDGRQWMAWIHLDDAVGAIRHAIDHGTLDGPVNATSPNPARNREFTRALGRAMRRPAVIPAPAFGLRLAFGEMADETLLASQRAMPERLLESGYRFRFADLDAALTHEVAAD